MKHLELNLNKRLLIVELPENCELAGIKTADKVNHTIYYYNERMTKDDYPIAYPLQIKSKFICKGSELTEDIAEDISDYTNLFNKKCFADYKGDRYSLSTSALESFISAVNASGHHWGEKPLENCQWKELEELNAKSRTFTPEKCIIFEIV